MSPDTARLIKTVALVDELLHSGRYSDLEQLCRRRRLSADQIKNAVEDYPEELAVRPDYQPEDLSVVHVTASVPAKWSVCLDLWRRDGGRSDLTAMLTLIDSDSDLYEVEIDDIHVL